MNSSYKPIRKGAHILETFVDSLSLEEGLEVSSNWTLLDSSRTICFCNVHSLVTASVRADLAKGYADADLVLPDGTPVAWMLRLLGHSKQKRISGPDFMWQFCRRAESLRVPVYFYGNRRETLDRLIERLRDTFPGLQVAGSMSPPYRVLTDEEDRAIVDEINQSGAKICFVSLGCPKQELWMAAHSNRLHAVMLGVGAAFDYHAGTVKRPPVWVRNSGLEWLCRLIQEPRRLWKRYLLANSIFVYRAGAQAIDHALNPKTGTEPRSEAHVPKVGESET